MKKKETVTKKQYYIPPQWCQMALYEHFDGMGGCWSVNSGYINDNGIEHCKDCEHLSLDYYEKLNKHLGRT